MIKLSENKTALVKLETTIKAFESIHYLIEKYSEEKVGPAYCAFDYIAVEHSKVQFDRKIIVEALEKQKEKLVTYLASLGIDANS